MEFKMPKIPEQELMNIIARKLKTHEIKAKTRVIKQEVLAKSPNIRNENFQKISSLDIEFLFYQYDSEFFNGFFRRYHSKHIVFNLSNRMTRSAGKIEYYRNDGFYKITISVYLLFESFRDGQTEVVNGIHCSSRLEGLMRVLEHEIVHFIELLLFGQSSCRNDRFKTICHHLFRHTESSHKLLTADKKAAQYHNIRPGDTVTFFFENRELTGIVTRFTKRATVMVPFPDGEFVDRTGTRYRKYYVPLKMLRGYRKS